MRWTAAVSLGYLLASSNAEQLNLGKIDDYKPSGKVDVPKLEGDAIWLSPSDKGYHVALSQQTQDNVAAALKKCTKKKPDNACYQGVNKALLNSNVELDQHGDRRRFVPLVFAVLGVVVAEVVYMYTWYEEPKVMPVHQVPEAKATQEPKPGSPLSLTADGATMVVVTPTPVAAPTKPSTDVKIKELDKPTSDAHLGFAIGDDLAKKFGATVENNKKCDSGKTYKRSGPDIFDMVGCASQAVVAAAAPGGMFRDMQFLGQGEQHIELNQDNRDLADAAREFGQFVRDYAPMLGLTDPAVLDEFGLAIFLMVYESILEPAIVQAVIPIKDKYLKNKSSPTKTSSPTASASSSASSCPDPEKTTLFCGYGKDSGVKNACDARQPKDGDEKVVCDSGKYKDCECAMPGVEYDTLIPYETYQLVLGGSGGGGGGGGDSKPTCSGNIISHDSLAKSFNSKDHKVYAEFCKKWSKGSALKMAVNVYGSPTDGRPDVPSSDPDCGQYQGYQKPPYKFKHCPCMGSNPSMDCDINKYTLNYEPKDAKQSCDCAKAFEALGTCTRKNSGGAEIMNQNGKIDAGCGTFSFDIYGSWPKKPEKKCNGLGDKYAGRPSIADAVDKYCKEDAVQKGQLDKDSGSIQRTYYAKTPGEVSVSIDFKPGMNFKISHDDCMANVLGKCVDECDVPSGGKNPMNWKGGGSYLVHTDKGDVRYSVTPMNKRKPAPDSPQGHCHVDYKFGMLYNGVEIWGAGWESDDDGSALKKQLKGCALFPSPGYKLEYEQNLDDKDKHGDGREWTAYFRTGIGQRKCTGHAVGSAGGFDWGCSGGGA